jgi:hypothetical protein
MLDEGPDSCDMTLLLMLVYVSPGYCVVRWTLGHLESCASCALAPIRLVGYITTTIPICCHSYPECPNVLQSKCKPNPNEKPRNCLDLMTCGIMYPNSVYYSSSALFFYHSFSSFSKLWNCRRAWELLCNALLPIPVSVA